MPQGVVRSWLALELVEKSVDDGRWQKCLGHRVFLHCRQHPVGGGSGDDDHCAASSRRLQSDESSRMSHRRSDQVHLLLMRTVFQRQHLVSDHDGDVPVGNHHSLRETGRSTCR